MDIRLTSVAWILAALMCGAAIAGYYKVDKIGPDPTAYPYSYWCGTGAVECCVRNVEANAVKCPLSNEAAFREARAKALTPDKARLRRAVGDLDIEQAVGAWRRISQTEMLYDEIYRELKTTGRVEVSSRCLGTGPSRVDRGTCG